MTLALYVKLFRKTFIGFSGQDPAAVRLRRGLAALPEELYVHARPFRHLWLHVGDDPAADAGGSPLLVATATLFAIALVLIHHIHLPMYVPTIITIVVIRHYLTHGSTRTNVARGVAALIATSALFFAAQFRGTMPIPETEFVRYLKSRMVDPTRTDLMQFSYIWYQPLAKEIADTWGRLPHNSLGVPVFALLIWLHTPLWRYLCRPDPRTRRRHAPPSRDRSAGRRQPRLSRDVRDGVRLFALDLELGGLHVPDPARGKDAAGQARKRR